LDGLKNLTLQQEADSWLLSSRYFPLGRHAANSKQWHLCAVVEGEIEAGAPVAEIAGDYKEVLCLVQVGGQNMPVLSLTAVEKTEFSCSQATTPGLQVAREGTTKPRSLLETGGGGSHKCYHIYQQQRKYSMGKQSCILYIHWRGSTLLTFEG